MVLDDTLKYEAIHTTERLKFRSYLQMVCDSKPESIIVLTNSDVALDPLILSKSATINEGEVFAISRYEEGGGLNPLHWCSQDTWVMRGQDLPKPLIDSTNFNLGWPGCELRFTEALFSYGFKVSNPALDIINIHHQKHPSVHKDTERYYGAYIFSPACHLESRLSSAPESLATPVYLRRNSPLTPIPTLP